MKPMSRSRRLLVAALGAATVTIGGCGAVGNLMAPPPSDTSDDKGDDGSSDQGDADSDSGPSDQ